MAESSMRRRCRNYKRLYRMFEIEDRDGYIVKFRVAIIVVRHRVAAHYLIERLLKPKNPKDYKRKYLSSVATVLCDERRHRRNVTNRHKYWIAKHNECVAVFSADCIDVNYVVHESVHIAHRLKEDMAFYGSDYKWPDEDEVPEEAICYPAGIVAAKILEELKRAKVKVPFMRRDVEPTPYTIQLYGKC